MPEPARWAELIVSSVELDGLAERLDQRDFAVVFRGAAGRGKSTHLRALHARFPGLPWTYLGPEASPHTRVPRAPVRFIDEAQRLAPVVRRRVFRGGLRGRAALALTSHEDLRPELEAAGYRVEEHTIGGLDAERLAAIVVARLRWSARPGHLDQARERLGSGSGPLAPTQLAALVERHGDDLRTILDELYEQLESLRHA